MKMKVLIRSLVLLAGLAAWTADTAWGQSSSRHSSSRGGTPVRQAAAQQRGEDDAVETVDLGDKKRESGTASGEREGVADAPEMPKESASFPMEPRGSAPFIIIGRRMSSTSSCVKPNWR